MAQRPSPITQAKIMPRLSAPLSKLRKQWLSSVLDLDPQAALAVLRQRLQGETDGVVRLGNIAAQSWIIRQRLVGLQNVLHGTPVPAEPDNAIDAVEDTNATPADPSSSHQSIPPESTEPAVSPGGPGWIKLRILAETEVNGMRFFEGTTIQVHEEDARKLIEAKSAELVASVEEDAPKPTARPAKKTSQKK